MTPAAQLPLTIVADDLTGACDTGALFAARGPVPVTVWPDPALRAPVSVVDTESRALAPADAARRVTGVARNVARTRFFKKIDSTLRGPIGAELDALLRASSTAGALVCPALPAEHRVVVERVLTVGAVPVAETPFAEDPTFPRASGSSNVVDLLRPQLDRPLAWIPLGRVREGGSPLTARLGRLAGMVIVADAETDADLDALVEAVLALDTPPLLVGAAGLALALARRLGLAAARVDPPAGERWLIVAGSRHPATRRQVDAARDAGLMVLATPDEPQVDRAGAAAELAAQARARLDAERIDVVLVAGGETLVALYHALGAERLDLEGAPRPGLALGRLRAPGREPVTVVTKAGGFGDPDLFVNLVREAVA
jgi:D-threonate/D-erythronate kinase